MKWLNQWWLHPSQQAWITRYLALQRREKILLQVTLHVILLMLVFFLVFEGQLQQMEQEKQRQHVQQEQLTVLQYELSALQSQQLLDPNDALRTELTRLQAQQQDVDERIAQFTNALVSPAQMATILEQLMQQDRRLSLVSLQTMSPTVIDLGQEFGHVTLFQHGLRVVVKASYVGVVDYLQRLDALPSRLFWQNLHYRIDEYPQGVFTFEVFTVSMREEVLGG
ncbi:MAG: hypothetical protein IBX52_03380 [Bacterioplanes sp.]|nr:hypothetical protein [Bacterioplanes sp.]